MAEIINLNKARKTRAKAEAKTTAATNRAVHGLSKSVKDLARAEREKTTRLHEQTRREPPTS